MAAALRASELARSQLQAQVSAQEEAISVLEQVKVRHGRCVCADRWWLGLSCAVCRHPLTPCVPRKRSYSA